MVSQGCLCTLALPAREAEARWGKGGGRQKGQPDYMAEPCLRTLSQGWGDPGSIRHPCLLRAPSAFALLKSLCPLVSICGD